jgi:uncharacterized protein with GYD domain
MSIFITQGRYTHQSMTGLVGKPEDREAEVKALVERSGGKFLSYYVTFGEYDWMLIYENSDELSALAGTIIGAASGTATGMKTTMAFTGAQAKVAFERAQAAVSQFRAAGA